MNEKLMTALKLAGKMAIAAQMVIYSDIPSLSENIMKLQNALSEYDNHIFNMSHGEE